MSLRLYFLEVSFSLKIKCQAFLAHNERGLRVHSAKAIIGVLEKLSLASSAGQMDG